MKKKTAATVITAAATAAGIAGGLGYLTFYEVLNRNASVPDMMYEKETVVKLAPKESPEAKFVDECSRWAEEQEWEKIGIVNDRGQNLFAQFLPAAEPSDVYVFCSHGYRSTGRGEYNKYAKFYHDNNVNVFVVDHQASGMSDGKWISFGYYEEKDCITWLNYMTERFGRDIKIFLHGISMGCATVTMMTGNRDLPENVKFTIADCGYTSMRDEFEHNLKEWKVPCFPLIGITNMFNRLISKFDYDEANPLSSIAFAKIPVLFIHGGSDNFVPTKMVYELYAACPSEKELLVVDGADHAASYQTDPETWKAKVLDFIKKYI